MTPVDCDTLKCAALTYDDGPGPHTEQLLGALAAKNVKATFFVLGRNSTGRPGVVARMAAEGHAVGNHTWGHADLVRLPPAGITEQLVRADRAIEAAAGPVTMMRPPFGATNLDVTDVTRSLGLAQIMWSVDTLDWKNRDAAKTTALALEGARPGSIILMHDIYQSTVQATPTIIDGLRRRGFTLVTVPQLLGPDVAPGNQYFSQYDGRIGPVAATPKTAAPVPPSTSTATP